MRKQTFLFLIAAVLLFPFLGNSQEAEKKEVDHSYKPLKVNLNEDGSKYIRFITWHQWFMCARYR